MTSNDDVDADHAVKVPQQNRAFNYYMYDLINNGFITFYREKFNVYAKNSSTSLLLVDILIIDEAAVELFNMKSNPP